MNRIIALTAFAMFFAASVVLAEEKDDLRVKIRQVHTRLPEITVYLNILDETGTPVTNLDKDRLTATIDNYEVFIKGITFFEDSEETSAYIFLVNLLESADSAGLKIVQKALHQWIKQLKYGDLTAISSFGSQRKQEPSFTSSQQKLNALVDSLAPVSNKSAELIQAFEISDETAQQLPTRKVIILITDESFVQQRVSKALQKIGIPIYAIGFMNPMNTRTQKKVQGEKKQENEFEEKLQQLARYTNGEFLLTSSEELLRACFTMRKKITDILVARMHCPDCPSAFTPEVIMNGLDIHLKEKLKSDTKPGFVAPILKKLKNLLIILAILILGFGLIMLIIRIVLRSDKKQTTAQSLSRTKRESTRAISEKKRIHKLRFGNAQHIGARKEQQDAFGFSNPQDKMLIANSGMLAVVADGMGGMSLGREASNLAVRTFLKIHANKSPGESIEDILNRALRSANQSVLSLAKKARLEGDVGTTVAAVVVHKNELHWISVGDSRIYLFREGTLTKLTVDHIYIRELAKEVAEKKISQEEALNHPDRYTLTSYLGLDNLTEIEQNAKPFPLRAGDRLLLCSDGLYQSLSEEEMATIFSDDPVADSDALVMKALAQNRPDQDNITALVLAYD